MNVIAELTEVHNDLHIPTDTDHDELVHRLRETAILGVSPYDTAEKYTFGELHIWKLSDQIVKAQFHGHIAVRILFNQEQREYLAQHLDSSLLQALEDTLLIYHYQSGEICGVFSHEECRQETLEAMTDCCHQVRLLKHEGIAGILVDGGMLCWCLITGIIDMSTLTAQRVALPNQFGADFNWGNGIEVVNALSADLTNLGRPLSVVAYDAPTYWGDELPSFIMPFEKNGETYTVLEYV